MALPRVLRGLLLLPCAAVAWDNGAALVPPLAWSSWYALSTGTSCESPKNGLSESAVLENGEVLRKTGLASLGFDTMILDDCWQNETRDTEGFLREDARVFPRGIGWLVRWLRGRGLKLGLYTTPGEFSCMKRPASQGHERQDVQLWFEEWGAAYLKYCVCNTTHARREVAYAQMQELLRPLQRPVVYEIDPAMEFPMTRMDPIGNVVGAHDDVPDEYEAWVAAIDDLHRWGAYSGNHTRSGHWPLVDILQVGRGGQRAEEYRSQVSMYVLLCSPLVIGVDLRNATWAAAALPLLTNPEVIAIHQDPLGRHATRVGPANATAQVWVRPLHGGSFAVGVWNVGGSSASDIALDTEAITGRGAARWRLRDVWARRDLGVAAGLWSVRQVQPHALRLLKLSPPGAPLPFPVMV